MTESFSCPACGRTMAAAQGHCQACSASPPAEAPIPTSPGLPLSIGDRFRDFTIEAVLSSGKTAIVYKARQTALDRPAAVKVVSPELVASKRFIQRFDREARTLAKLNHPNIVQVYDYGEERGVLFLAMEFVEGSTLEQFLVRNRTGRLSALLAPLTAICDGLDRIHGAGLVHRDIKPSNVLMPQDGVPKISDFGLAIEVDDSQQMTQAGAIIGTPHYMSPEQILGQPIDGRSDLYALGILLYQAVSGRLPFEGPSTAVLVKHVQETPPRLRDAVPGLPAGLDALTGSLLAKTPAHRPPSALAVKRQLEECLIELRKLEDGGYRPAVPTVAKSRRRFPRWGVAAVLAVAVALGITAVPKPAAPGRGSLPELIRPAASSAPMLPSPAFVLRRLPEPPESAQVEARRALADVLQPAGSGGATRLLDRAKGTEDVVRKFVLLRAACEEAVRAGDADTALGAIRSLGAIFEVQDLEMTEAVLSKVVSSDRSATPALDSDRYLQLALRAMEGDRYDIASRAAALAETLALKAGDQTRGSRSASVKGDILEIEAEYRDVRSGSAPESVLGAYWCFFKGDWDRGLPFLSKSPNESVRALAQADFRNPSNPHEQVAIADGWHDLARVERNTWKKRKMFARAVHWYETAWPYLRGALWDRVQLRLGSLDMPPESGEDLIARVHPSAQPLPRPWMFQQGALTCPPSNQPVILSIPGRLPEEYDLVVKGMRTDWEGDFRLDLPLGTRHFGLVLEGGKQYTREGMSGLDEVDDLGLSQNATRRDGRLFANWKEFTLLCRVRKGSIQATVDGRRIVSWRGLPEKLRSTTVDDFQVPPGTAMKLLVFFSGFRFSKVMVAPAKDTPPVDWGSPAGVEPTEARSKGFRPADSPANLAEGLKYEYFEAAIESVQELATLQPTSVGVVARPELIMPRRAENYAIRFSGFIRIPADADYRFTMISDDGSKLLIGATEVVSNDGLHPAREQSGTIGLQAGIHAFTLLYFNRHGTDYLNLFGEGPGMAAGQLIPGSLMSRSSPPDLLEAVMGPARASLGLTRVHAEDGLIQEETKAGKSCALLVASHPQDKARYLYFDVNGGWSAEWGPAAVEVEYLDEGTGSFSVHYDGASPFQQAGTSVRITGTQTWKTATFTLPNPAFQGRQHGGADFRISREGGDLWIHRVTLRPAALVKADFGGLSYEYFEGRWNVLPDFNGLTPVSKGFIDRFDLSRKKRAQDFGFRFKGWIEVPREGKYRFSTISDDGSALSIGESVVVSNDGLHGAKEESGEIELTPGRHPITVAFFQNHTGSHLSVFWSGPGFPRQEIPAGALHRSPR